MTRLMTAAAGLVVITLASSPALAGKRDDAWAACLWEKVPTSASNWIAMPEGERWSIDPEDRANNLKVRLEGACREAMTPPGKKSPPGFNEKRIRAALVATKPETIDPDQVEPKAHMCKILEGDLLLGMTWGFGDPSGVTPRAPATSVECFYIQSDGGLAGA